MAASLWSRSMAEAITSAGAAAAPSMGAPGSPGTAAVTAGPGGELGFYQIIGRLREVVMRLESGDLSLEQSLLVYEEGVQLARRGQHLLASAERRVEILVSASGGLEVAPFDEPGPG